MPSFCSRTGSGPVLIADQGNTARNYYNRFEHACAKFLMEAMVRQARGEFNGWDVTGQLSRGLFRGAAAEWSPYQVFLDNLAISQTALDALNRAELGTCTLGSYLMNVCNDVGNWFSGIWSQGRGTTYGNVFLTDDASKSEFRAILRNRALLHHEQVHAQQWAQMEWNFAAAYLEATRRQGQCNVFEKRAGFIDGGYFTCI